ncbi:hypothetical protein VMCG_00407 [Cytospora schulzeri]|uniref:Uncharacterized protein n=1 Tax=Cytospora schulzeri TaxID=448051 RepID=A0A423X8J4_9PEZI|nr:hypothetical protein VMCG_00407 [Valsa malicola]
METHLNGVVIYTVGDLTRDAKNGQWSNENTKRWVEARGGKLVDVMSDSVTHLICSIAAYKSEKDDVKLAQRIKCKIVTYEWLEDAILLHDQLKKKAPTNLYHPGKPRAAEKILALYKRKQPKAINKKVQADAEAGTPSRTKDDMDTTEKENEDSVVLVKSHVSTSAGNRRKGDEDPGENMRPSSFQHMPKVPKDGTPKMVGISHPRIKLDSHQIYKDPTDGFLFQVEISRADGYGDPRGKRWLLQLLETKETPKLYRFTSIYFKYAGAPPNKGRGSGADLQKDLAMKEFKDFFSRKTGFKWEERLLKASKQYKGCVFQYHLPVPGEPVGYIHPKYMPGKAKDTQSRDQNDYDTLARDIREHVPSLKRKRAATAEFKAAQATQKKTAAFDDVSTANNARL